MTDANDTPKIIIDDDWKEQARKEKEEADRQTREQAPRGLPEPSILELVQILVMQVSVGLGGMQDPATGQTVPPNLPLAKHYIDLLEVLRNKTTGNLDENEQKIIDGTLHELRMYFVQVVSELSGAVEPPVAAPKS